MHGFRRCASLCCTLGLLAWMACWGALPAGEYAERISSFETDAEAFMFTYDGGAKGWARVSDKHAAHGDKSLEVKFVMTEAELGMSWPARFFSGLARNLGISAKGGEGGKLAGLGRSKDALPFDWTAVDALVFDAYNPSMAPLQLSLKVKSGLSDGDPTAKFYHTEVMLPARKWAPVRLSQRRWVTISIPPESSTPD